MTKDYFIQLANYNIWANNLVHSWFEKITDEQWKQPVVSSFGSIGETALHVAAAESVWLDRLNNVPSPVWLPAVFKGSKKDLQVLWAKASAGLKLFVEHIAEAKLSVNLSFKRRDGIADELAYYQILAHVFNHSTYHRGQVVTMLRQTRFAQDSSTDLSGYYKTRHN